MVRVQPGELQRACKEAKSDGRLRRAPLLAPEPGCDPRRPPAPKHIGDDPIDAAGGRFSGRIVVHVLRDALDECENVEVEVFAELVVEFARQWGARTMVKGLRAISDFEWEFQMHHLNRNLAPEVETMYLMSSPQYSFLSSSGVKEVASFGGDVHDLVPEPVAKRFREMFPQPKGGAPVSPQE